MTVDDHIYAAERMLSSRIGNSDESVATMALTHAVLAGVKSLDSLFFTVSLDSEEEVVQDIGALAGSLNAIAEKVVGPVSERPESHDRVPPGTQHRPSAEGDKENSG